MSGGWTGTIYHEVKVEINIDVLTVSKVVEIENAMKECIEQKLEKLNIILKSMNVYSCGEYLLVNDRYGIGLDIKELVESFGMKIVPVANSGLRGKTYIVSDDLVHFLKIMGVEYQFGYSIANTATPISIEQIIHKNTLDFSLINHTYDNEIASIFQRIKRDGKFTIEGIETIAENIYDDQYVGSTSLGVKSDRDRLERKISDFLENIEKQVAMNNTNMKNGTTQILYSRARQMGYSVEKKVNGKEVQLVLVRVQG